MSEQERWLVLNKSDLMPEDQHFAIRDRLVKELEWTDPVFIISAATGFGCQALCNAMAQHLNQPIPRARKISKKFRGIHAQAFEDS